MSLTIKTLKEIILLAENENEKIYGSHVFPKEIFDPVFQITNFKNESTNEANLFFITGCGIDTTSSCVPILDLKINCVKIIKDVNGQIKLKEPFTYTK